MRSSEKAEVASASLARGTKIHAELLSLPVEKQYLAPAGVV